MQKVLIVLISHAKNLVDAIAPIMKQYSFSDLNLDIESSKEASDEARLKFTQLSKDQLRPFMEHILFAKDTDLGGIGLWALGYEGSTSPYDIIFFVDSLLNEDIYLTEGCGKV